MEENKFEEVKRRYIYEINEIKNKLKDLENGRIYELTSATMDGYLATNISYLREKLNELLYKIVNEEDSVTDKFKELF